MRPPRTWSDDDLGRDASLARAAFREERLDEPEERYGEFFDRFDDLFAELTDEINHLFGANGPGIAPFARDLDRLTALRYVTAPPISSDDLDTLAETKVTPRTLATDPLLADRVRWLLLHVLDRRRFPWVGTGRPPTEAERRAAIVASAALVAARRTETERRGNATKFQEAAVRELLLAEGYQEVARRKIAQIWEAPEPGRFCGESMLGDTRADLVVRLFDGRLLAIECKASNSAVNSFKRLVHEAGGKSSAWLAAFGNRAVVPAAVLSGVYSPANLATAQTEKKLTLFWSHRLNDLAEFVRP